MAFSIISLLNAVTWFFCTVSFSTDYRWIDLAGRVLVVVCIILNVFFLISRKKARTIEKASMILYTLIGCVFFAGALYFDN